MFRPISALFPPISHNTLSHARKMTIFSSATSLLGYETLPAGLAHKSFYDLSAPLPGKDKVLDFVSFKASFLIPDPPIPKLQPQAKPQLARAFENRWTL